MSARRISRFRESFTSYPASAMRHQSKGDYRALMSLHTVLLFPHQSRDGPVDIDPTGARFGAAVWKIDPALVEPVDHLHAGKRVAHALAAEDFLPVRAGLSFGTDRSTECLGEGGCDCVWCHPLGLELDDTVA